LGPYHCKLKPEDTQSMVFQGTDDGPFWMSMEECENTRLDKQVQDKVKTRTLPKKAEKTIIRK